MGQTDREVLEAKINEGLKKEREETKRERKRRLKQESKQFQSGFKKFVTRGDVVELAVALAISAAFNKIVNGIVEFIITPLISIMTRGISMSDWKYVLSEATEDKAEIALKYGSLIEVTLDFFIIALMLYLIIRVLTRIKNRINQAELDRIKAEEIRKKEEARLAAEQAAAQAAVLEAERKAIRDEFFENAREEKKILLEIRDSLINLQNSKA